MHIFRILDINRTIKNMLDNYLIPLKNGCLTHVDPKLYTKCPLQDLNNIEICLCLSFALMMVVSMSFEFPSRLAPMNGVLFWENGPFYCTWQ
jgi:hypothetical protein